MKNIIPSKKIYSQKSKIKMAGRGVFALKNIKKNEIIEHVPYLEIDFKAICSPVDYILLSYVFFFKKGGNKAALALGLGSLYNHSRNSCAKYIINQKDKTIAFTATEDIKKDEEITINYSGNNNKSKSKLLWFE